MKLRPRCAVATELRGIWLSGSACFLPAQGFQPRLGGALPTEPGQWLNSQAMELSIPFHSLEPGGPAWACQRQGTMKTVFGRGPCAVPTGQAGCSRARQHLWLLDGSDWNKLFCCVTARPGGASQPPSRGGLWSAWLRGSFRSDSNMVSSPGSSQDPQTESSGWHVLFPSTDSPMDQNQISYHIHCEIGLVLNLARAVG